MSQLYALLLDEPQHSNSVLLTRDQKGVLHRIRMTDSTVKELKVKRRNAKAALTRQGKALRLMIEGNRATDEVSSQLEKFELVYDSLVQKHEAYTEQISDDDEFTTEEEWLEECQQMFIALQCEAKDHLHVTPTPTEKESNPNEEASASTEKTSSSNDQSSSSAEQISSAEQSSTTSSAKQITESDSHISINGASDQKEEQKKANTAIHDVDKFCGFKMEKPKMPKTQGMSENTPSLKMTSSIWLIRGMVRGMPSHCCVHAYKESRWS